MTSKLSGLPFRWKFHAVPVSLDMVISLVLSVCICFACVTCEILVSEHNERLGLSNETCMVSINGTRW